MPWLFPAVAPRRGAGRLGLRNLEMKNDTFGSTDSLKGIAIVIVLINHYLNMNVAGDSTGFANLWIVVFFMLSGYGIQYSLASRFEHQNVGVRSILAFYYARLIRILPLFWMAYLLESFLFGYDTTIWTLSAISGVGHYWFIPAIIQCYFLAPFNFLLVRKNRFLALVVALFVFVSLNWMLRSGFFPPQVVDILKKIHLGWRNVYFLYLLVFFLSMLLPKAVSRWSEIGAREKNFYFYLLVAMLMMVMVAVKFKTALPYLHAIATDTLAPMMLITIASIYLVCNRMVIPYFSWIGRISYPVYLFHMIFYLLIKKYLDFGGHAFSEAGLHILLFPIFLHLCSKLEKFSGFLVHLARLEPQPAQNHSPHGLV
jgi:peptidoglycan/LPS O-acetylase OafA/YrhL